MGTFVRAVSRVVLAGSIAGCGGSITSLGPSTSAPIVPSPGAAAGTTASPASSRTAAATGPRGSAPAASPPPAVAPTLAAREYPVPAGAHPHDIAPAADGGVWYTGQGNGTLGWLDPATGSIREIPLPADARGANLNTATFDGDGIVWLTDFAANAIVRFDPATERFDAIALSSPGASVRQLLGRPGELWGAESGVDKLVVITER